MNHYGVGHPNASDARCNERTLSDKDSQKLIQFYQASELLGWLLGRMCRWYVVDFILICGRARFWWGWVWRDGSFLNAVLGWNFTNSVRLKWMYVIAMATWWGQHMCMTFKPNDSKWLQSYVYFIAFMFFSGTYYVKLCNSSCWSQGLLILLFFPLFAAESAQLAHLMTDTFHSIPLSVSGIPLAFPTDSRFCQVCTAMDCPNRLTKGVLTWQNPQSTTHSLPTF